MELVIRRIRKDDLAPLVELLGDERVMRHLEPPLSTEQARAFLAEAGLAEPPLVLAVEDAEGFAGYVIYHPYDERLMELGWVLAPRARGRGYATELTRRLVARAASEGRGAVIEFAPEQAASREIARRCGFAPDGTRDDLEVWRRPARP